MRVRAVVAGVAAVAVVGAALAAVGLLHRPSAPPKDGPVRGGGGTVWAYPEAAIGTRFSDGLQELQVDGAAPVTITSVTVVGGDRALTNLGAMIGLPGRRFDFWEYMKGFPPPALPPPVREPAVGAELRPGIDYMLVIGYEVRRHVADRQTAVVIGYTADGKDYQHVIDAGIVMCPPAVPDPSCEPTPVG